MTEAPPTSSSQRATCAGTPAQACRTTKASTPIASIVSTVSRRDSPLLSELDEPVNVMTSAESLLAAVSKDSRVRVESSKNVETTVLPLSAGTLGIGRRPDLDERVRQPHHLVDAVRPQVGHAQEVPAAVACARQASHGPVTARSALDASRRPGRAP